jgi:hydrogenase nickel incorporation protein HypA/HybF
MHELSIAQNILEIVLANLPAGEEHSVRSVKVKVGEQSGVVADSLEFCFTAITQGTPLEGAVLDVMRVPFALKCKKCDASFQSEAGIVLCPSCGGMDVEVLSGTELQVVELELRDVDVEAERFPDTSSAIN